ncbi:MAG: 30S ribosomal protein S9 [Candidatus Woesearchaeota archaeon]
MKIINTAGKRKSAIARAVLKPGKGIVRINSKLLDVYEPKLCRMKIQEPLILAGDIVKKIDININVRGGGQMSQAESSRLAIGKALTEFHPSLKKVFLSYDRTLLIADVRRKEQYKPNVSKARKKRAKSYR